MKDKKAFTPQEQIVIDHLTLAWNAYVELQESEPFEPQEAIDISFHVKAIEARIGMRVLVRDYPLEFKPA